MLNKSLTTTILIIILVLASAVASAKDHPKGKEGAGCQGLANAMESMPANSNGNSSVNAQYVAHGCAPTDPQDGDDNPPPGDDGDNNPPPDDGGGTGDDNPPPDDGGGTGNDNPPPDDGGDNPPPSALDSDGDGFFDSMDCEPTNPSVYPGSPSNGCGVAMLGSGSLQITLVWDSPSNLDLKVAEPPYNEIIYWGNVESYGGGELDKFDTQCSNLSYVENIHWEDEAASGSYTIHIVEQSLCGATSSANWILTIRVDGVIISQYYGSGSAMIPFSY